MLVLMPQRVRGIEKAEQIGGGGSGALKSKPAIELILGIEHLTEARLQRVLVRARDNGNLIVVTRIPTKPRQGVEVQ